VPPLLLKCPAGSLLPFSQYFTPLLNPGNLRLILAGLNPPNRRSFCGAMHVTKLATHPTASQSQLLLVLFLQRVFPECLCIA